MLASWVVRPSTVRLFLLTTGAVLAACTQFSSPSADVSRVEVDPTDASAGDTSAGDTSSDASASNPGTPSCDEPDLLGRWRLQEGVGSRVFDCTSGARHGDLFGGTWVNGRDGGKALSFVGGDNGFRVDLGNAIAFRLEGAMTLSAWINVKSAASYGRIFAKSSTDGDRGWDFFIDVDKSLDFRVATGPNSYESTSIKDFPQNQWKHVAAVYEPGIALRLYIDGIEAASNKASIPSAQRNSNQPAYIGARSDCCTLDGMIYEVRLYTRALSVRDIATLLTAK